MNINDLKAKLAGLNQRTKKSFDTWKPKDEHDVRLVRDPRSDDPLPERAFHYNIGDAFQILCPKANYGDECAICDYADHLRAWKDEDGRDKPQKRREEDFEIFKKIQAVSKVFVPMVERLEDGKSVSEPRWWGLTKNQAEQILEVCTDADRLAACDIDPTDGEKALDAVFGTKKAFDLHVSFRKPGEKGNTKAFTVVDIKPKFKVSPLTGNGKKDDELASKIKPLDEVFARVPSAEVEKALRKFIGEGSAEAKPEGGEEKYAKANSNEKAEKAGKRSVEDAFSDLVGEEK